MQIKVVGIKFKEGGKNYFFDPNQLDLKTGECVIVETAKGHEFAYVASDPKFVGENEIISPLKDVVRIATNADKKQYESNVKKQEEALVYAQELIEKYKLDMKLVEAEYAFDGSKINISFVSDNRVDFRDLVKELAIKFKTRIELRQIGIRDQSKAVGGIGICGRECCCATHLNDFEKVSIKMAKIQGLSLNPTKISGLCGRLMCCLEYENPTYQHMLSHLPKIGSEVTTPEGKGTVTYLNVLKGRVSAKIQTSEGVFVYKDFDVKDLKFNKSKHEED